MVFNGSSPRGDGFDCGPSRSQKTRTADAYCNFPSMDAPTGDETLPRPVLVQAAQGRFQNFQPGQFGHEADPTCMPGGVQQCFARIPGNKATFHKVKIAGVPVYAKSYSGQSTTYVVIADCHGNELTRGCYPQDKKGHCSSAFWQNA
jgi:hypothetical protein